MKIPSFSSKRVVVNIMTGFVAQPIMNMIAIKDSGDPLTEIGNF